MPTPVSLHGHRHAIDLRLGDDPDAAARRRELRGVGQEIEHDLRDARRVGIEQQRLRRNLEREADARRRQLRLRGFDGALDDRAQIDALLAQRQLAAGNAAHVHQVIDQPHQLRDLTLHHAGRVAGGFRQRLHPQDRRHVAQRRERIAKLVRERGEEFVLELRFVMQPMLAILDRGARFLGFVGAALGLFLGLPQLRLDFLALGDVDQQPLAFGRERRLLLLLQR